MKYDQKAMPVDGNRSAFVGVSSNVPGQPKIFFDLDKLSTHTLVAGATGSGKTVAAQVLVEEALKKGVSVVVFDPTAQWTGFLRPQKNQEMLSRYSDFGLSSSDAQGFKGTIQIPKSDDEHLDFERLMKPGALTVFCLNRLKRSDSLEDGAQKANQRTRETSKSLNKMDAMLAYLKRTDLSAQSAGASPTEQFVSNSIMQVFDANFPESGNLKMLLVYDEVHRLLPKFGGTGHGFRQIERAVREFRKWGVGLILISQVLSDFVGEIRANIGTEMQMRTKYEGDLDRVNLKYSEEALHAVVKSPIGTGLVQNAEYNRGFPFMVSFRPLLHNIVRLSDAELAKIQEYNNKLDAYVVEVEKAKKKGADLFDLELELNLARDKIQEGSFNIVDVCLESMAPKISELKKL
ncbi:MAG: ATP-binding protein [Candidatus Micrarchaeia archaeon]